MNCKSKVQVKDFIARAKSKMTEDAVDTQKGVIAGNLEELDERARQHLGQVESLARVLRAAKQKAEGAPVNPDTRTGFEIPAEYRTTASGHNFLQYDSGADDQNRLLIFATDSGLDDLCENTEGAGDGTFRSCSSNLFAQLFALHCTLGERSLPRANSLLPNKSQLTYTRLYKALKISDRIITRQK